MTKGGKGNDERRVEITKEVLDDGKKLIPAASQRA